MSLDRLLVPTGMLAFNVACSGCEFDSGLSRTSAASSVTSSASSLPFDSGACDSSCCGPECVEIAISSTDAAGLPACSAIGGLCTEYPIYSCAPLSGACGGNQTCCGCAQGYSWCACHNPGAGNLTIGTFCLAEGYSCALACNLDAGTDAAVCAEGEMLCPIECVPFEVACLAVLNCPGLPCLVR